MKQGLVHGVVQMCVCSQPTGFIHQAAVIICFWRRGQRAGVNFALVFQVKIKLIGVDFDESCDFSDKNCA